MSQIRTDDLELDDPELEQRLELMRGPVGAWPVDRDVQARALAKLGLRSDHHFLEIGCGPLQSGIPLIRFLQPGHYTGVDISGDRLDAGRALIRRFGLEEQSPRLVRSDDFGLDQLQPGTFDRLWSFHVVIHFPLPLIARFMEAAATLLKPTGMGWFSAWVTSETAPFNRRGSWLEFPVTEAGSEFFHSAARDAGLECIALGTLDAWGLPADRPAAKNVLFQITKPAARAV